MMTECRNFVRSETDLPVAWARAFLAGLAGSVHELAPFFVSIGMREDGRPAEDEDLRDALDACLGEAGQLPVEKVAKSIFPQAVWQRCKGDRAGVVQVLPAVLA